MAFPAGPDRLNAFRLLGLTLVCWSACAQTLLTLEQAASRKPPDFLPAYTGQEVRVQGRVSTRAVPVITYSHVAIQDDSAFGLTLEGRLGQFQDLRSGDWIEVRGTVSHRAGLPVLQPVEISKLSAGRAIAPRRIRISELNSFRYLGLYVETQGEVWSVGQNEGGYYLEIGDAEHPIKVFLPYRAVRGGATLARFAAGDRVRVKGIASQYCPLPPHNRLFQILISDAGSAELLDKAWPVPAWVFIAVLAALGAALAVWSMRERRMAAQRRVLRGLYRLGEQMTATRSSEENLEILRAALPDLLGVTTVQLYLWDPGARTLRRVEDRVGFGARTTLVDDSAGPLEKAVATCYRNRSLLAIPETHRSPFFHKDDVAGLPRSALFVPMFAQNELMGVLEIDDYAHVRHFSEDQQAVAQHLANQIAIGVKLRAQQSIQEQLFRSEKLAATGQLISGVAGELEAPLEAITNLTEAARSRRADETPLPELRAISNEARKASEIVSHLLSFTGRYEETASVDLTSLLRGLLKSRESVWSKRQIQLQDLLTNEPILVTGLRTHLEQVFLSLLDYAAHSAAGAAEKNVAVRAAKLAGKVQVEITCPGVTTATEDASQFREDYDAEAGAVGLGVCQAIVRGHGGEIRLTGDSNHIWRFEVELPAFHAEPSGAADSLMTLAKTPRRLTTLLVEPDARVQRRLVTLLGDRDHRAVPASSAEEAAELVKQLHFHVLFCSVRLPGMNWIEFRERVRGHVDAFVLLTEGYDADLSDAMQGQGYLLAKPVEPEELDRLLGLIDVQLTSGAR